MGEPVRPISETACGGAAAPGSGPASGSPGAASPGDEPGPRPAAGRGHRPDDDAAAAWGFFDAGWTAFAVDPGVSAWAEAARGLALRLLADPAERARWLRHGGTWFAGVGSLANDPAGGVPVAGIPPLCGPAPEFVARHLGLADFAWDAGQLSICLPGYPRPDPDESPANARFRRERDAAHVDGLLRREPGRRRVIGEFHGFILGLPLTASPRDASPLVVWEGSHEVMRRAFRARLAAVPPSAWAEADVTEAYVEARRHAFETCRRVVVHVPPGGSYLVHRLALHGVAPWGPEGGAEPRAIAYFRPDPRPGQDPGWWLDDR